MDQAAAPAPQKPAALPISDQLIRATARIECTNGSGAVSCGTGFFFHVELDEGRIAPLLVTNRHVVDRQVKAVVPLTVRNRSDPTSARSVLPVELKALQSLAIYHPNPGVDLAAIIFAPVDELLRNRGLAAEYVTLTQSNIVTQAVLDECRALEDLIMIGYPNGIWDKHNNRPIIRSASSATPIYENYNNEPKFLIDCACFPGSSGSPVFLFNQGAYSTRRGTQLGGTRVALVGILHAGFLHVSKGRVIEAPVASLQALEAEMTVPNSVGICIKAVEIAPLIAELKGLIAKRVAA